MYPPFLQTNDQIQIVSPSGVIESALIDGAKNVINSWGLQATEGPYARTEYGRFAGTREQRLSDLQEALDNPELKAILCSRGGYGLAQIVDKLDFTRFVESPKWLIGFSDITILHNLITKHGFASIHGIMAKHLTELPADSEPVQTLKEILFGDMPAYTLPTEPLNREGKATGRLIGGNLSVLMGLRGTAYDLPYEGNILFLEEIAEQPYHIDRMMQNLRIGGALAGLSGMVVGQFSDCDEDSRMYQTVSEIVFDAVKEYDYPVCFNFPSGHVDYNLPLLPGANVSLEVTASGSQICF